jgi:hypothetical protein
MLLCCDSDNKTKLQNSIDSKKDKKLPYIESEFNNPDLCKICCKKFLSQNNSIKIHQKHIFCKNCVQY